MKKNILKATLVAAMAVVASVNVYNAQQSGVEMSDLALANVEALASGEGGGRGCTLDRNAICETSHADYIDYRNN